MPCGRCSNCVGRDLVPVICPPTLIASATCFVQRLAHPIEPKARWPKDAFPQYGLAGAISPELAIEKGRALSIWGDAGWGERVRDGKYADEHFGDELVKATADMIGRWKPEPAPQWICAVPSLNHPSLVSNFAERLAKMLHLPFRACLRKGLPTPPQKEMQNSFQQARNLDGAFQVDQSQLLKAPLLLIDDMIDSGWTFAVTGALLRRAGVVAVFPVALAVTSKTEHD